MTAEVVLILTAEDSAGRLWSGPPDQPPDVAVGSALGDGVCVTRDTPGESRPSPATELLDYLRQIVTHPDVPDTVQADAREYLRYLEAASSGSAWLSVEARLTMAASAALHHGREVVQRLPRPRSTD